MIAIYTRQSIDKKDSVSIEVQIEFCKKQFSDEEFKVYNDKGYSGSNINRPAFEEMIDDIHAGNIEKVIVYRLDRISRSLLDFANIIEMFNQYNVEFISSTEKFDTGTPIGRAMLNIIMVFAQLERETIQLRIKDNYYSRGKQGLFMGGRIPFGYVREPYPAAGRKASTYAPNPIHADIVKNIYKLYSTTLSTGQLTEYLNKILPDEPWANTKITRILRNPCYVKADADIYMYYKNLGAIIDNDLIDFNNINGCFLYGDRKSKTKFKKENIEGQHLCISVHPGLVDSSTWLACQYKLDNSQFIRNTGKGKVTWLSGLTKCIDCGYAMVARRTGKTDDKIYFYCKGKYDYKCCDTNATWNTRELENYIEELILKKIENLRTINFKEENINTSEINDIKLKIVGIDEKIENLINQLQDSSTVTAKYINERIEKLDSEKKELSSQINNQLGHKINNQKIIELVNSFSSWQELSFEDKKNYIRVFINRIYLGNNNIDIEWIEY
jgi:DNA invertase Pin-like site-specific DNA recombinase